MPRTIDRALDLLLALADIEDATTSLSSLAHQVGLPKSTVVRLLETLEERGLVTRNHNREVALGPAVLLLAHAFQRQTEIGKRSLPFLRALRDASGETASLHIALGRHRVCVEQVESRSDVKWVAPLGKRLPVYAGAPGKALCAFLPLEERRALFKGLELRHFTPNSITSLKRLEQALDRVGRERYAMSIDEVVVGASGIASPLRNHSGRVIAALALAGPTGRLSRERLTKFSQPLLKAAADLSAELGWRETRQVAT